MATSSSPDRGLMSSVKFAKLNGVAKQMNCSAPKIPVAPAMIEQHAATMPKRHATTFAVFSALLRHSATIAPTMETTVETSNVFISYSLPS